ncbi:hypothetical protein RRG08_009774 [Elysia crispata]|uniref:Uncharacterized protein n=1 Tax=Elysia crispata TaxID=231223 RepID=A0AAE0ZR49_9GAST|nr:hypothetical protein RRG08_009774 [Elysia crispata]
MLDSSDLIALCGGRSPVRCKVLPQSCGTETYKEEGKQQRMCWPHVKVSKAMYIDYYPDSAESSGYEVMWDFIWDITHRRDFICEKFQS